MSEIAKEPTATEVCDMLLKAGGVTMLAAVSVGYVAEYLRCVPDSTLWTASGPLVFITACYMFAGRVVIWDILGPAIAVIPVRVIRALIRLAVGIWMVYAVMTAATVFSPMLKQDAGECPSYTVYTVRPNGN